MVTPIAFALLGALVVSIGFLIAGDFRLVVALRRDHPEIWEKLGRPSPWFNRFEEVASVHRFLQQRAYRATGDVRLIRLCDRLRLLTIVTCILAASAMAVPLLG